MSDHYSSTARNTLNDYEGNNGIFTKNQITYNNNTPSDDLGTYVFTPGKVFIFKDMKWKL